MSLAVIKVILSVSISVTISAICSGFTLLWGFEIAL